MNTNVLFGLPALSDIYIYFFFYFFYFIQVSFYMNLNVFSLSLVSEPYLVMSLQKNVGLVQKFTKMTACLQKKMANSDPPQSF